MSDFSLLLKHLDQVEYEKIPGLTSRTNSLAFFFVKTCEFSFNQPVSMLQGELPEGYMRIKSSEYAGEGLRDEGLMPAGYRVRFDEGVEAVVLSEFGSLPIETYDTIDPVTYE